jgi:hypothetical protein
MSDWLLQCRVVKLKEEWTNARPLAVQAACGS